MKWIVLLATTFLVGSAHAYSGQELREDCQAADDFFTQQKQDPYQSVRSARCLAYVAGFADGYSVSDYLADKVGVRLNAFCLPNDPDLVPRLVRAVLLQLERVPPGATAGTARIVASALARSFPCADSLEPVK